MELTVTERTIDPAPGFSRPIPVRLYEAASSHAPNWATLVWSHGGSFVRGTLDWPEADWVARRFAESGVRVVSVDYALASTSVRAPQPSAEVQRVLDWALHERAERSGEGPSHPVVVGGASAGGQLSALAALMQAEAHETQPSVPAADALVLVYPTLHRRLPEDPTVSALTEHLPEARQYGAEKVAAMYEALLGPGREVREGSDSTGIPLVVGELPAARLAALPPTVIVAADADDLRTSAERFSAQLTAAGVDVDVRTQAHTLHGFLNRPDESPEALAAAQAAVNGIVGSLRRILSHP